MDGLIARLTTMLIARPNLGHDTDLSWSTKMLQISTQTGLILL